MAAFSHIINKACELEVDTIVGAGDLIDVKKPTPAVANFIRQQLDQAKDCGITFAFIQGQHELSRDVPWFSAMHSGTEHIDGALLYLSETVPVYAIDWQPASKVADAIAEIPDEASIIVMHQVWKQFMGIQCAAEASFSQIPGTGKLLFTGDYHFNMDAVYDGRDDPLRVISPGSTNIRAINEPGDKYFYVLYDNGEFEACSIPSRLKQEVRVRDAQEVSDFCSNWPMLHQDMMDISATLPEELRYPLLWLKYPIDMPEAFTEIEKIVDGKAEIFRKEIAADRDESVVLSRIERDTAVSSGLLSCLELLVERDSEDYGVLYELLTADDQAAALDRIREARGVPSEA